MSKQVPPPPPGFELDEAAINALPPGFVIEDAAGGAALKGAKEISETPWYQRKVPVAQLLALGVKPPETVAERSPGISVQDVLDVLPAAGGAFGGLVGAGTGVPTAGTASAPLAIGGAALGGATGEAARQIGMRAIGGYAPTTSAEAAKRIAAEAAIQAGAEGIGVGTGKVLKSVGTGLMQSAVKPNPSLLKEYKTTAPKLVQTLLDEGINVSPRGLEKLDNLLTATNKEISAAVANARGTISRDAVVSRAGSVRQTMAEQVNPRQPLRDVRRSLEEFRTDGAVPARGGNFSMLPPTAAPLTVPEAQAMKVGTYQQIGKSYGQMSSAKVETQKALARGLKEEIERAVPKIRELNKRDAELMAAGEAVGHRISIAGNRDPIGFAWVASHAPQTFLAALIDRAPAVKSMLARGMYSSAGKAAKVSPQLIRSAVVALTSEEYDGEPGQE